MRKNARAVKNLLGWAAVGMMLIGGQAQAAENNQSIDYDQVRRDYKLYLEKIKELSEQYKGVTQEITKVLKEEGVPAFDEKSATITTQPFREAEPERIDGRIRQTDKEMIVSVDLPGLQRNTIEIKIRERQKIHILARRKDDPDGASGIEKMIPLPGLVQEKGSKASYEDGVLTIRVQKSEANEISVPLH